MSKISTTEVIDLSDIRIDGWEFVYNSPTLIAKERDSLFLGRSGEGGAASIELRKTLPVFEVGKNYKFSMSLRAHEAKEVSISFIVGNGAPGVHTALRITLGKNEVTPGKWQHVDGFVHLLKPVAHGDVELVVVGGVDINNVSIALAPSSGTEVIDLSDIRIDGWKFVYNSPTRIAKEHDSLFLGGSGAGGAASIELRKTLPVFEVGKNYKFSMSLRAHEAKEVSVSFIVGNGGPDVHTALNITLGKNEVTPGKWQHVDGFIHLLKPVAQGDVELVVVGGEVDINHVSIALTPSKG